jgi:hypothetical protein
MDEDKNPLDRKSKVNYDNFMLEINSNGYVNREELAKQFELDIESYTDKNGLFVVQGDKIIKRPYDISYSTRKINESITAFPSGFSKIFYAEGSSSVTYTNPQEPIPSGCWCTIDLCDNIGPEGHSHVCSYPNQLSLNLTLKGFIECIYSTNKAYRSRLRENDSNDIKNAVDQFIDLVEQMSVSEKTAKPTNDIFIRAALGVHENARFKFLARVPSSNVIDPGKVLTNFKYRDVRNIPGLKKGRINYFHGATMIQYFTISQGIPKRSSIRVYDNGKITIIPCIWDENQSYETMITKIFKKINETDVEISPKDAFISVANGSFRLIPELIGKGINLEIFYKTFHPTDDLGNPLPHNNYMSTHTYVVEGGEERIRKFVQEGQNRYTYTITEEGRGKLSMTFIKYEDNEPTSYKITTQIYNTGIVQLIFAYKDDDSKEVEKNVINSLGGNRENIYSQIESQTKTIRAYFELIRKFLVNVIDTMYNNKLDIFEEKEINKKSSLICNSVPGVIPYKKKVNMYAGYVVDFFDDSKEEWDENYGWSVDDSERGIIVNIEKTKNDQTKFKVITGEPRLEQIVDNPSLLKIKFKTAHSAPIVELADGSGEAYLIEPYISGKAKHWVISGEPEDYTINQLRTHKQSINSKVYIKDTQVCDKTKKGIDIRPDPYSFFGKCVHPDTTVLLANGELKSIKDLIKIGINGQSIQVVDPITRKIFLSDIAEFQNYDVEQYSKKIMKITTRSGRSIIVTDDHTFARPDGNFTDAGNLKINDQVLIMPTPNDSNNLEEEFLTNTKLLLSYYISGSSIDETVKQTSNYINIIDFTNHNPYKQSTLLIASEYTKYCLFQIKNIEQNILKWSEFLLDTKADIQNGTLYDRIDKVERLSNDECPIVMDLTTVSNVHTFVSNGFVTHNCPGGLSQYINRIGFQSRKDNKFYPACKAVTDKNRKQVEEEVVEFLLNGLSDDQLSQANIDPKIELFMHGVPIKDKYAGTFKPGTIDIGNTITYWDEYLQQWSEATLIDYNKSHGLGNDLNYTSFILQNDSGKIEVRGEQFHPKHRESRNFDGLNNLIPDEKERREFLINCAKKLNLVKPDIQIQKTDNTIQLNVLKKLGQIIDSSSKKGSFVTVVNGSDPFIEKNIMNLTKQAYEAVIIPDDSIRCILFIIDNIKEQYLIDSYDKVRHVSINFYESELVENTIIDGYITEKNDFYPFDLLVQNGVKVNDDYMYSNDDEELNGRLIKLQLLINSSTVSKSPNSIMLKKPLGNFGKKTLFKGKVQILPFIGPIDQNETLLQFVKKTRKPKNDIIFVPQKGSSKYIIWKHYVPNIPIVVQILKQLDDKDGWIIGLIEKTADGISKPWKLLKIPINLSKIKDDKGKDIIFKKNDFVKLKLNIMTNGIINENTPYVNPTKVSKDDAKTFEETKIDINLITRSIKEDVFQNSEKWEFAKIQKVFISEESSRLPLKEKIYKYTSQLL